MAAPSHYGRTFCRKRNLVASHYSAIIAGSGKQDFFGGFAVNGFSQGADRSSELGQPIMDRRADGRGAEQGYGRLTAVPGVIVVLALPLLVPVLGLSSLQFGALAGLKAYRRRR